MTRLFPPPLGRLLRPTAAAAGASFSALLLAAAALPPAGASSSSSPGFSNTSATLKQVVGQPVASALGSMQLSPSGWLWDTSSSSSSSNSSASSKRASAATQGQSAEDWAKNNLNLYNGRFAANPSNLVLISDPAASGSSSGGQGDQVLSVTYAANSYGLHSSPSGGTSFYAQPFLDPSGKESSTNTPYVVTSHTEGQANASASSRPQLLLAYSVYFPDDFNFVQGGKLPGLYSSVGASSGSTRAIDASTDGCEGGSLQGTGTSCWSARVMWREGGQGEVYVYVPQKLGGGYKLCPSKKATAKGTSVICNSDYGLSLGRGSFTFRKGSWNDLALYIQVNSPGVANGQLALYVNGASTPAIHLDGMVLRSGTISPSSLSSPRKLRKDLALSRRNVSDSQGQAWVDKIMFTSFFGGNSASWATPGQTQTYFKDVAVSFAWGIST